MQSKTINVPLVKEIYQASKQKQALVTPKPRPVPPTQRVRFSHD